MKKLLVVTGEVSGDLYGANLIQELRKLIPDLSVFGIGGEKLKQAGAELIYDIKDISVVGFWEVIPKICRLRRAMKLLHQKMITERPTVCLLIDYPGFNLRVAKLAKKQGMKVVYYILPQVWAWGRWRIKSIAKYVDIGISILPFEREFYKELNIEFVGHPLLDIIQKTEDRRQKTEDRGQKTKTIALLPGSRKGEIKRILPIMLKVAELIVGAKPLNAFGDKLQSRYYGDGFNFVIPIAPGIDKEWVEGFIKIALRSKIRVEENKTYEVLMNSDMALIASGTATLEACLLEVPSIIIYCVSLISYIVSRLLVKVKWIGLPNLIANKEIMPEFIQFNATPSKIIVAIQEILKDRENRIIALREVKTKLGLPGAVKRVAQILYEELNF
ncbi:MAG: lipid-A-disaccharide synthase [Candidatus Stahlbacteria bacterium]|nr:lipid-A-disaccharide synthase [Candidatus Stahlbacteria bacterium]